MNSLTFNRRGLRALMLGVAVALAGGASVTAFAQPGGRHHDAGFMMGGSPEHIGRMLDSVNATEAQRSQIKQISEAAAADLRTQREAGKGLREQQMQLFTQPTVDANAVEAVRKQLVAQHDQSSRRMSLAMIEVSRVLTPEQRVKLAETMKARRDTMMKRHQGEGSAQEPRR